MEPLSDQNFYIWDFWDIDVDLPPLFDSADDELNPAAPEVALWAMLDYTNNHKKDLTSIPYNIFSLQDENASAKENLSENENVSAPNQKNKFYARFHCRIPGCPKILTSEKRRSNHEKIPHTKKNTRKRRTPKNIT